MYERYDYVTGRVTKDGFPDLRRFLAGAAAGRVAEAGGVLWGSWLGAGSIGWDDDQLIVMVAWPGGTEPGDAAGWLAGTDGVDGVEVIDVERVEATVRPQDVAPLTAGGVLAHRWLELEDAADFEEIMALSAEAWPAFEGTYDATVEGFFQSVDDPARVLLVTRYASVAEWERSRGVGQAQSGDLAAARDRFLRRRHLTRRQVVRIAPLA